MLRLLANFTCITCTAMSLAAFAVGCGAEPVCGVDQIGNDVPVCLAELEGSAELVEFCPGDHWATAECQSCSCLDNGRILCGEPDPECSGG